MLKHDQSVDSYLEEKVAEIQVLAEVVGGDRLKAEAEITSLHNALVRSHGSDFVDLGIVNADGIQEAYAGPYKLEGADYSEAEWFKAREAAQGLRERRDFRVARGASFHHRPAA